LTRNEDKRRKEGKARNKTYQKANRPGAPRRPEGCPKRRSPSDKATRSASSADHTARAREEELDAYIKELVEAMPPLTERQHNLLALMFRKPNDK
jgi:hypothetical protein